MQAITTRLDGVATLVGIHELGFNFYTGLIHIKLRFQPNAQPGCWFAKVTESSHPYPSTPAVCLFYVLPPYWCR